MKRSLLTIIGTVTLLTGVGHATAQQTLYDRIKQNVEEEVTKENVEPEIAAYVAAYFTKLGQQVTVDNVSQSVRGEVWQLCGTRQMYERAAFFIGCTELRQRINAMVAREQRVRALGRAMELSAAGQEIPVADVPGRAVSVAADLRGIINIWSAEKKEEEDTDDEEDVDDTEEEEMPLLRTKNVDADAYRQLIQTVGTELNKLSDEEKIAAVWRYQYGVRLVTDKRAPEYLAPYEDDDSGPGTERQYMFKHWTALESALDAVWNKARAEQFDPPLKPGESAILLFPSDFFDGLLPDNTLLWARVDGGPRYPLGDVGLQWKTPLEPVLPSLISEDGAPILGGTYPPAPVQFDEDDEPVEGRGLCSDPLAARGYLCRRFEPEEGERCPDDPNNPRDPNAITLTLCESDEPPRTTIAGPDVCRGIPYTLEDDDAFDPQTQCTVALRCASSCGPGYMAITSGKDANGVIEICVNNSVPGGATYLLYHELHHAYQECALPPAEDVDNHYAGMTQDEASRACCSWEGEAYRAQCDMMEQDGMFTDDEGNVIVINGITLNAETCAETFTNDACAADVGVGCYVSKTYPANFSQSILGIIDDKNPANVPMSCTAATDPDEMDPRVADLLTALEERRDACAPGFVMSYKNRIGNNLCYIGQCVEESAELHRMTGVQSPATVGAPSNAWDDPQTGTALGNAVTNPPLTSSPLPSYRPQLLLLQFEQALCQSQGKPPLTPSVLCRFDAAERLLNPIIGQIENAQSFLVSDQTTDNAIANTLVLTQALGARVGTDIYATYLQTASRSLADILSMAVKLFHDMDSVTFPTQMCPLDGTLPPAVTPRPLSSASSEQ